MADREGLLLLDLKDLKALLAHLKAEPQMLGEDSALFAASSQALLRRLATLEQQGAEALFGEPALQLEDILQPAPDGRGVIHLLDASTLVHEAPKVYATFLLWLLAELFEQLPERATPIDQCWRCSSTRRTCCSVIRQKHCRSAWCRWYG